MTVRRELLRTRTRSRARAGAVLLVIAGAVSACTAGPSGPEADAGTASGSATSAGPAASPPSVSPAAAAAVADAAARFGAAPTADGAVAFVVAARAAGDARYGPHLLDLVRVGYSSAAADQAFDGLAELSGIARTGRTTEEYLTYGQWVLEEAPEAAPGYAAFKAALYYQVDDEFVPLLLQVTDARVLAGLQWGGVGVGAIGELNDPRRIPIDAPAWAQPDEAVFAMVGGGGTALVYPERILARHELANDVLDGVPVSVSFCTLCRASRLFDRRVEGRTLTFRTSGLLLNSNKVMVDNETSSLWTQLTGQAIAGPLTGAQLTELPIETTTWADWQARHPDAVVVDKPAPTLIDPETGSPVGYDYQPDAALAPYYASDQLWYPVLATPDVFALKETVATLALDGAYLAVGIAALAEVGSVELSVGERRVVASASPRGVRFTDAESGAALSSGQSFWFAWYGLHPDTTWWPAA